MTDEPKIPFGYKLVEGQAQKGDGVWDGKRFRKAKKEYPHSSPQPRIIIRKCEIQQAEIQPEPEAMEVEL